MKGAEERDEIRPLGVIARELQCHLDRFGPGVAEEAADVAVDRQDRRERFRQPNPAFGIKVGDRDVQIAPRLLDHDADDIGMRVTRGGDRDARRTVQKAVAVDVLDDGNPRPSR